MFQATGLFAFVRKMPNISTSGGGGVALFVDAGLKVRSQPDALSGNYVHCLGIAR